MAGATSQSTASSVQPLLGQNPDNPLFVFLLSNADPGTRPEFISKPMQFEIHLASSSFSLSNMIDVRVNKVKGTAIITTKLDMPHITSEATSIKIGPWSLTAKRLRQRPPSTGVIGPVDLEEDLLAIKQHLLDKSYPVLELKRLYKRRAKETLATNYIKVDFDSINRPPSLVIGFTSYPVNDYHPPPIQCFHCQRFGHLAGACNASRKRCVYCSENHTLSDCPKSQKHCANCGSSDHLANYGGCPGYKLAQKIERLAYSERISYIEAKKRLVLAPNPNAAMNVTAAIPMGSRNSFSPTPVPSTSTSQPHSSDNTNQASQQNNTFAQVLQSPTTITTFATKTSTPKDILTHPGFITCLLLKLFCKLHDTNAAEDLIKDAILSCNQQFGSQYADEAYTSVLNVLKTRSLLKDSTNSTFDLDFEATDDLPLLSENQSFSTPPASPPPLKTSKTLSQSKTSKKKQHSPESSPSSKTSKKQKQ